MVSVLDVYKADIFNEEFSIHTLLNSSNISILKDQENNRE
jgi:hypothetical protein